MQYNLNLSEGFYLSASQRLLRGQKISTLQFKITGGEVLTKGGWRGVPADNLNINRWGGSKNVLGQKWQPVPLSLTMGVPNNYL